MQSLPKISQKRSAAFSRGHSGTLRVQNHDVIVIGGGPAGATTALRLAELGYDVGIVERECFPRPHVGICVSDQTLALTRHIGPGMAFRAEDNWQRRATAVRWQDNETRFVQQPGYHLDRALFDALILQKARTLGVSLYQPAKLTQSPELKGKLWQLDIVGETGPLSLTCTFVVDAAGRRPAITGPRSRDGSPLIALHAEWTLDKPPLFDGLIEAGKNAWIWYAQTAMDRAVVTLFYDPRKAAIKGTAMLGRAYAHYLDQFTEFRSQHGVHQTSAPMACDASSTHSEDPVGDHFIKVGDAALSIDPLASQGVHLAMLGALQAAVVTNTILRKPENAAPAKSFYRARLAERVQKHSLHAAKEYARAAKTRDNPFWALRAAGANATDTPELETSPFPRDRVLQLCKRTKVSASAVIEGDFVERNKVVTHPSLDVPIKYLDQQDLVALLGALPKDFDLADLSHIWADHVDEQQSARLATWLWQRRILVPVSIPPGLAC